MPLKTTLLKLTIRLHLFTRQRLLKRTNPHKDFILLVEAIEPELFLDTNKNLLIVTPVGNIASLTNWLIKVQLHFKQETNAVAMLADIRPSTITVGAFFTDSKNFYTDPVVSMTTLKSKLLTYAQFIDAHQTEETGNTAHIVRILNGFNDQLKDFVIELLEYSSIIRNK